LLKDDKRWAMDIVDQTWNPLRSEGEETLTAGKAKKEMPRRANPADSMRPVHVLGVLSP